MRTLRLATLLLVLAVPASAQVQLSASKDNTLYNDQAGLISNGLGEYFFVGRNADMSANPIRRGLLAFDVAAAIPAGSQITSVDLILSLSQTISGPQSIDLHRLNEDWGEGASDAPGSEGAGAAAQPGDATWKFNFFGSSSWSTLGGSYVAAPSASLAVDQPGFYTWISTPALVADVQSWLDAPAGNFGWILRGPESTSGSAKRFDSKDNIFPSLRPVLVVNFTAGSTTYCTAKTTSSGCVPAIGSSGTPSVSAGSGFLVTTVNVDPNQFGIFFYSKTAAAQIPFQGGFLCAQPPIVRTPVTLPTPGTACTSSYLLDFNSYIATGADPALIAGLTVYLQNWFRDPLHPISGSGLSDGLAFILQN